MVLHNPSNWHWVSKDCMVWAKEWFSLNLVGTEAEEAGNSVIIDRLVKCEGDCDLSQRKGKLVSIFDVKIVLEYSGKAADETEVSGRITIPEVAHDTGEDEYQFDIDQTADTSAKQPVKDLIRSKIIPQLRKTLASFAGELSATHGNDIQHNAENAPAAYTAPRHPATTTTTTITAKTAAAPAPVCELEG